MGILQDCIVGGSAGLGATILVQPLDLVKTRMQLLDSSKARPSMLSVIKTIVSKEGPLAVYDGMSAALFRQATYTTTRLGIYQFTFNEVTASRDGKPIPFWMKAGLGMFAGAAGALVGTPAELALIRMTADGTSPLHLRRNYRNVFHALFQVVRTEGLLTLWRGCGPTITRAVVLNAAQLSTYSQAKEMLIKSGWFDDSVFCHTTASFTSGFFATAFSIPVDNMKTRIQNMRVINGKPEFKSSTDALFHVIRTDGVFALWRGFTPYLLRLGPHTVLTFLLLEQLKRLMGNK